MPFAMSDKELQEILARAQANKQAQAKNTNKEASENPLHNLADNSVTKSNALARAYYRFPIVEKRCMEALISKLHPLRKDNDLQQITLHAYEYSQAFGVSKEAAYRDLQTAVSSLIRTVITINQNNGVSEILEFTVMSTARYRKKEGFVQCAFNPFIVPHLIGLREKFTSYPLQKVVSFQSSYTWRFYEILASWAMDKKDSNGKFIGWVKSQPVDELRSMLGVPDSYSWGMFQKKVLDVITRELREKAKIALFIENIKTVRKITHLNISFIEDDQIEMALEGGKTPKKKRVRKPKT